MWELLSRSQEPSFAESIETLDLERPLALRGHEGPGLDAVWSAHGRIVATASADRTVRVLATRAVRRLGQAAAPRAWRRPPPNSVRLLSATPDRGEDATTPAVSPGSQEAALLRLSPASGKLTLWSTSPPPRPFSPQEPCPGRPTNPPPTIRLGQSHAGGAEEPGRSPSKNGAPAGNSTAS